MKDLSGNDIALSGDLGDQILVAASMQLSAEGIGLFVVTPRFFTSPHSLIKQFNTLGLGLDAALALPSGTFAPQTNMASYLVMVRKHPASKMFVDNFLVIQTRTSRYFPICQTARKRVH